MGGENGSVEESIFSLQILISELERKRAILTWPPQGTLQLEKTSVCSTSQLTESREGRHGGRRATWFRGGLDVSWMSVENVLPQGAAESQPSGSQLLSCGQHHGIGSTVFRDREDNLEQVQRLKPAGALGDQCQWAGRRTKLGEEEMSWGNKSYKRVVFLRRENGTEDPPWNSEFWRKPSKVQDL